MWKVLHLRADRSLANDYSLITLSSHIYLSWLFCSVLFCSVLCYFTVLHSSLLLSPLLYFYLLYSTLLYSIQLYPPPNYPQFLLNIIQTFFIFSTASSELIYFSQGRVACEMNTCDELIATEMLFYNVLLPLNPPEAVAVLSALVFDVSMHH